MNTRKIVLASTSRYRRELLGRLGLPFHVAKPDVDETPLSGETPEETALRLARAKAAAVRGDHPDALIIGSDQVAVLDGKPLGKPGNFDNARAQLRHMSGRTVVFETAVALLDARDGSMRSRVVPYRVVFRDLDNARIEAYLRREQPYDCAGSAKTEGLGIALLRALEGDDPTALVGLPLIAVTDLLLEAGVSVL